jgi:hypothetical protein
MKELIFVHCASTIFAQMSSKTLNPKIHAHGHVENEKEKGW